MNALKIIGIVNRYNEAPKSMKENILAELETAIREEGQAKNATAIETLRDALTWDEVKDNPLAVARIGRSLRALRDST